MQNELYEVIVVAYDESETGNQCTELQCYVPYVVDDYKDAVKKAQEKRELPGTMLAYVYTLNLKKWAYESGAKDDGTDDDKNLTPGERALKECGFKLSKYTKDDDEICIEYSRHYGDDYRGIVSFTALKIDGFYYEASVFNEDTAGNLMAVDLNSDLLKAINLRLSELNGAK